MGCAFCGDLADRKILASNEKSVAFPDAYPLGPGHTLVVPRRHEADYFALSPHEQSAIWQLVGEVRWLLAKAHNPDGFNVGINVGEGGGQTIFHAHIHVIPRFKGDVKDPRGGIRWVLPEKAKYWD